jgi:hypothetical protein
VPITVQVSAAAARMAATLARLVTTQIIEDAAQSVGLRRYLDGSNKAAKLNSLLLLLLDDRRRLGQTEALLVSLTMQAHERAVRGTVTMTEADADSIVGDMRIVGLKPGDLARRSWRSALKKDPLPQAAGPATQGSKPETAQKVLPRVHVTAVEHVRELVLPGVNPQHRGRQLELILQEVLHAEQLEPERNVVIPGEQIDLAFTLDAQHYLVECKWEAPPLGLPPIELFATKVSRKAEGTFGVVLSMSGFVADVNEKASRGARLNCVGVAPMQFMHIIEGRTTWSEVVRTARRLASTRSLFWSA